VKKVLIGAGVVLVLGTVVFASIRGSRRESGKKVYAEAVERREISRIVKASGEIDPREKVNISAHVIGKIERLYVEEGDEIASGKPFLDLEKETFVAERDQWAAQVRSARSAVERAQVMVTDGRRKAERARSLHDQGVLSRELLEAAEVEERSSRLRLSEAEEAVRQAQANLDRARDALSKTTIYAPLSGRVIKLSAEEGEVVVSGTMNNPASVIGTIADLSEILARVDVDETEVVHVRRGQTAVVRVDALPDREYRGQVVEIGSSSILKPQQPDVTFFEVKVLLDQPDDALRPGMSVRAEINTATHTEALVVPIQAVVDRPPLGPEEEAEAAERGRAKAAKGKAPARKAEREAGADRRRDAEEEVKVLFVVEDGKARQRPVTTGISDETHVEILSGVEPGAQVVTGPYRILRDLEHGDAVRVSASDEDADRRRDAEEEQEEEDEE
jgi:HlyD family secretion protein